jgi:hypothetical protein
MHDALKPGWSIKPDELARFHVTRFVLAVPLWTKFSIGVRLNWQAVAFSASIAANVPKDDRGVYCFVVQPAIADHPACSYLMYVGKVGKQGLRGRYKQYLVEERKDVQKAKRAHITEMLQAWKDRLHFYYAVLPATDVDKIEDALLEAYLPPFNREFPATVANAVKLRLK